MFVDSTGEAIGFTAIIIILSAGAALGFGIGVLATFVAAKENEEEVRLGDVIVNGLIGAGAGLAIAGAGVALGAVAWGLYAAATAGTMTAATAIISAHFLGVTVPQAFACGALAINAFAFVTVPLFGMGREMEGVEYEPIAKPSMPSNNTPYIHPAH